MTRNNWLEVLWSAAAGAAVMGFAGVSCAQEEGTKEIVVLATEPQTGEAKPGGEARFVVVNDEGANETPQGDYWLGVQIAALPEVVKRQLAVEHGLAVEEVSPDSPAAKAEIKRYDILVRAGDTPLKEFGDLIKAVDASQGKEIVIAIVRGGKDSTVRVAAVKRPETARVHVRTPRPEFKAEIKVLEEALENLKNKVGKEGASLWFPKPAVVAPRVELKFDQKWTKETKAAFPKDLNVNINKHGGRPAEIHVKRGDKSWDVTEDKLGELPEDIRGHVQQMLGGKHPTMLYSPHTRAVRVTPEGKVQGEMRITPVPPMPPKPAAAPRVGQAPQPPTPPQAARTFSFRTERADGDDDSKLDAILKKLEKIEGGTLDRLDKDVKQMRKEIDELRKK